MVTTKTRAWNPTTHADYDWLKGKEVFSRDGEKVGTVKTVFHPDMEMPAARGKHYFLLDPGLLKEWFGGYDEVYLPESAIATATEDRIVLTYDKEQVKNQGWTTRPANFDRFRRV